MSRPAADRPVETERLRERVAVDLVAARDRSISLTDPVDDHDLLRQHSVLMSPLVWDLAHVGNQEEQWLVRDLGGLPSLRRDLDELYDAFRHARRDRPALPLLRPEPARRYLAAVRHRTFDVLAGTRPDAFTAALPTFALTLQHEQQHGETMLATHQLRVGPPVLCAADPPPAPTDVAALPAEVVVPAGPFTMGTSTLPWALDNERPAHTVQVGAFAIDTVPVSNRAYLAFVEDGGYQRPQWWSAAGWQHRTEAGLTAPLFWQRDTDGGWWRTRFGVVEPVPPEEPVCHVTYHEAWAYARWAGRRLPTEAEWEKAARFDPVTGRSRCYPWGDEEPTARHANLGQRHLRPAPVGSYPDGASPLGVRQLIGDVWEWTSTDFTGYPGFVAHPYRYYSEVFFGSHHKVLRGGSFGTDPGACRGTFRNWDYPIRRQIFAGFRCVRDLAGAPTS